MGTDTKIEWADHSWSFVFGCDPVHTGCENCYAQVYFKRFGIQGKRRRPSDSYLRKPIEWNREAEEAGVRRRVFPSLCDPFDDWQGPIVDAKGRPACPKDPGHGVVDPFTMADLRRGMFSLIDQTPNLDWLLLTKRPENIRRMWACCHESMYHSPNDYRQNVHLLYSASDQETLDAGIGRLLECRDLVPVLGLSLEPLVGPVNLEAFLSFASLTRWVIVGGESGPNARPCQIEWIWDIVLQCEAAGVPCFVKQLGSNPGIGFSDYGIEVRPLKTEHPKGGDPAEWPEDLRVQQYPEAGKSSVRGDQPFVDQRSRKCLKDI